ncbi:MAG: flagellar hook-basal body complex protein [Oscillospiraceae bacterium]|nr:flagellar hook-basal body complex protein [Oscillospiraceae bacterium]
MMRSLYSGISGLKNHQTRMDVIGNNIANVNTVGYKASRTVFQDIFSQTVKSGTANLLAYERNIGGTNPTQIGLGIKLATIDVLHTPAPIARTDNPFDMMIEGDGFFILMDENENYYYTRAGNFYLDDEGYLVSSHGYFVMGYNYPLGWEDYIPQQEEPGEDGYEPAVNGYVLVDPDDEGLFGTLDKIRLRYVDTTGVVGVDDLGAPIVGADQDLYGFSVGQDGSVSVIINNIKETIGFIGISMFTNAGGLEKAGNSLYRESPSSGDALHTMALMDGAGRVLGGGLEMSNVDLATEFTDMIVTQRGFQANSRVITVSDTLLEELVNLKR